MGKDLHESVKVGGAIIHFDSGCGAHRGEPVEKRGTSSRRSRSTSTPPSRTFFKFSCSFVHGVTEAALPQSSSEPELIHGDPILPGAGFGPTGYSANWP